MKRFTNKIKRKLDYFKIAEKLTQKDLLTFILYKIELEQLYNKNLQLKAEKQLLCMKDLKEGLECYYSLLNIRNNNIQFIINRITELKKNIEELDSNIHFAKTHNSELSKNIKELERNIQTQLDIRKELQIKLTEIINIRNQSKIEYENIVNHFL